MRRRREAGDAVEHAAARDSAARQPRPWQRRPCRRPPRSGGRARGTRADAAAGRRRDAPRRRRHRTAPRAWRARQPVGPRRPCGQFCRDFAQVLPSICTWAHASVKDDKVESRLAIVRGAWRIQLPRQPSIAGREEDSYCVLPGRADRGLVILCDHAGNLLPPEYGTLGLPAAQLRAPHRLRHRRCADRAGAGGRARRSRRHDALLAPADRPQPRPRRSDPHHAPLRRGGDPRQPQARCSRARQAHAPLLRALSSRHRRHHRPVPGDRRGARAAVDPLLHRELEGVRPALARRRALGRRCAPGQAPAGQLLCRGRPDRRRQRALCRPARRRLPVAARRAARPCQCHRRDPAGPDPRRRPGKRPGASGSAAS